MQGVDDPSYAPSVSKREAKVCAQMHKVASTSGVRCRRRHVGRQPSDALGYVVGDITLLKTVLLTPHYVVGGGVCARRIEVEHVAAELHGACQRHGVPLPSAALQQNFGRRHEPRATPRSLHQRHKHARIAAAGAEEQLLHVGLSRRRHLRTACQHYLAKRPVDQPVVEVTEVGAVALAFRRAVKCLHIAAAERQSALRHLAPLHPVGTNHHHGAGCRRCKRRHHETPLRPQLLTRQQLVGLSLELRQTAVALRMGVSEHGYRHGAIPHLAHFCSLAFIMKLVTCTDDTSSPFSFFIFMCHTCSVLPLCRSCP